SEDTADNIILDGHLREIGIRKPAAACGMVPEGDKDQAGQCLGKRIEGHCHRYSGVLDNEGGLKRNERDEQEKEQVQPEQGPVRPVDMLEDPVMGYPPVADDDEADDIDEKCRTLAQQS